MWFATCQDGANMQISIVKTFPALMMAAALGAGLMLARILAPVPLIFIGAGAGLAFHFLFRRKEAAP